MFFSLPTTFLYSQYMPHGNCYLWQTPLVYLHFVSDLLVGVAYLSIPAMLIYFTSQRPDLPFSKVFVLFSVFITACGVGHFLEVITLWYPYYWLSGTQKAITALVSCYTAFEMVSLLPQFLALKTPEELEKVNRKLEKEIEETQQINSIVKTIAAGTESNIGEQFFPALVINLATTLQVKSIFIAKTIESQQQKVEMLAFCEGENLLDNFQSHLGKTYYQQVIEQKQSFSNRDSITNLFSDCNYLAHWQNIYCAAVPLFNFDNKVIGIVGIIDCDPFDNVEKLLTIMRVFANRAAAEIEGKKALDNLAFAYGKLEEKVSERTLELETILYSLRQEINQRQKVEIALKREQEQLINLIETAPVAIAMVDKNMDYIAYSQKWINDNDLPRENLAGSSFYQTFPDLSPKWLEIHQRVLQGESLSKTEDIVEYQNQTLYISWAFQPWFDADGEVGGLIAVTQNIEHLVKQKQIALETAELKSQFLANMSHEIRTPMNCIFGIVEILKRSDLSSEQSQYVDTLNQSSQHLLFLINDILDFSKLEANQMLLETRLFDLDRCLKSTIDILSTQAQNKGLELFTSIEDRVPASIVGDENRLRQIIINLVANAIKFTERGDITIKISCESQTENRVKLKFTVIDTGIGISTKDRTKLFKSFSQVDTSTTRKYGGTGLGLAICKALVELMEGEIGVQSKLNQGSVFWFTANFEFDRDRDLSSDNNNSKEQLLDKTILIIDSASERREKIGKQLEHWGIRCEHNSSYVEAILDLQKRLSDLPIFDYVLVNWENSNPEKEKSIYQILLTHPSLINTRHILIISPSDYNDDLQKWLTRNEIDYLLKPLHFSELRNLLANPSIEQEGQLSIGSAENSSLTSEHHEILESDRQISKKSFDNDVVVNKIQTQNYDSFQDLKILVVEDNQTNQTVIGIFLNTLKYNNINFARNGREALSKLEENHYDLVLMDCLMPLLDGYETTKAIRQKERLTQQQPLVIIAMTANTLPTEKDRCFEVGMNDYVSKPLEIEKFEEIMSSWKTKIAQSKAIAK